MPAYVRLRVRGDRGAYLRGGVHSGKPLPGAYLRGGPGAHLPGAHLQAPHLPGAHLRGGLGEGLLWPCFLTSRAATLPVPTSAAAFLPVQPTPAA